MGKGRSIDTARRRAEALELRRAGVTYPDIAQRLGYSGKQAAHKDVKRALDQVVAEPSEQLLREEVSRLDGMLTGLWADARRGQLGAVDRVIKIMERRSRLLGLDHDSRQRDDHSDVDGWLRHMLGDGQ